LIRGESDALRYKLKKRRKLRKFFELRVPDILQKLKCGNHLRNLKDQRESTYTFCDNSPEEEETQSPTEDKISLN
jgi:hypothetical protein